MENKCRKCGYSGCLNRANECYCNYLEIVGCARPTKASECELYKDNPKGSKTIQRKKPIIFGQFKKF